MIVNSLHYLYIIFYPPAQNNQWHISIVPLAYFILSASEITYRIDNVGGAGRVDGPVAATSRNVISGPVLRLSHAVIV